MDRGYARVTFLIQLRHLSILSNFRVKVGKPQLLYEVYMHWWRSIGYFKSIASF